MTTRLSLDPGQCGYKARVEAEFDPARGVCQVGVFTLCPNLREFSSRPVEVRPENESRWETSAIHSLMRQTCPHTACPLPAAIIKAVQVASGAKKPGDVHIRFEREDDK